MSYEILPVIERQHGGEPTHSVIMLHGLGADGNDFYPIVPELGLPESASVRFVFPHAPKLPITINRGYVMPAWYDIIDVDGFERQVDTAGIQRSVESVRHLIAREVERGIPEKNIILAGFSQGGVIAYIAGLTHPERLGGIVALSTYLPAFDHWPLADANRLTPIFAAHGTYDSVVPYELGQQALAALNAAGYSVEWHRYPIPHSVSPAELRDIAQFLQRCLRD